MGWAPRAKHRVPSIGSPANMAEINDYSLGMNNFLGNDVMPFKNMKANYWRLAQDARITTLGQYETRKGMDNYNGVVLPATTTDVSNSGSATGAADQGFGGTNYLAEPFTVGGTAAQLVRMNVNIKNTTGATGVPLLELWTNSGGSPGTMIARSSLDPGLITGTYSTVVPADFVSAPTLAASTTYWLVARVQAGGNGNQYYIRSSTVGTDAKTSANSGATWSTTTFRLNYNVWGVPVGKPTIGLHQAIKSDGTTKVLLANGTQVAYVDEVTSDPTAIKTGLNANATAYRFVTVSDKIYYVNGYDGYRKWDFTTESQVNATNYTHICVHKGLVFMVNPAQPNRIIWSGFGTPETFDALDFWDVPAPITGDPITALVSLNGYLLIFTRSSKYIFSGDTNASFQLSEAPDQKGTFTQESTTQDQNFVYYLSDDGVYRSNGNEAQLISSNIYQDIINIQTKANACLAVNQGHLYMWYTSAGGSANDNCWVWSLNYDSKSQTIESHDTNAYVSRAVTGLDTDYPLIVGSSVVGAVFWQELPSNAYHNLGGDINFYLQTHYITFGSPAVLHEVRRWVYRVEAQSGNYSLSPEYAYDLRNNFQTIGDINVQGSGPVWGSGIVWGSFTWGTTAEVQTISVVPGEYRRIAFAYSHSAIRQPNAFLGHTFMFENRRLR